MMLSRLLLATLALVSCKSNESAPSGPAKKAKGPSGVARPQPKLTATLDGKPVTMQTAYVWNDTDGTPQFSVSSALVSCDDVTGQMHALQDGEVTFSVLTGKRLQPDGSMGTTIKQTYYDGMNDVTPKPTRIIGDGAPGTATTIDVDFASSSAGGGEHKLVVKGTLDALGCPAPTWKKTVPPLAAPMPATITVAGKQLPVRFAKLEPGTEPKLTLYTGGETCQNTGYEQSDEFEIIFYWNDKNELRQITLDGTLVQSGMASGTDPVQASTITPSPPAAGELEIKAELTLADYPVKVEGKVTATVCPK